MQPIRVPALLAIGAASFLPSTAGAADNTSTAAGASAGEVVSAITLTAVTPLRFGQVVQPTANGTLTIAEDGSVTGTGGVAGNQNITQTGGGRNPAAFHVQGDTGRNFSTTLPGQIFIFSGANSMRVNNFVDSTFGFSTPLDGTGNLDLTVGARLVVGANQPLGAYSGTYNLTVTYD
jgi:hypothetical protein